MCDPELDDIEFNTDKTMPMFNTKCYLLIKVKDYPIGKNLKCYVWFEGLIKDIDVKSSVKNSLTLSDTYKDYSIKEIEVVSTIVTNTMKTEENFGEIILQSITNVFEGNPKKQKDKKFSFKDIKYSELTDKDIEEIDRKLNAEIFKRQHKLSDSEYKFYIENRDEVDLTKVKEIYEKCGGDIFKLRKEKIRENIANLLENKKVVD